MRAAASVLLLVPALAAAAPAKPAPKERPADLPKAAPGGEGTSRVAELPPYFGFFGPPQLVAKTGVRGKVGSWVEFGATGAGEGTHLRMQQVAPEVRGGRWIEVVAEQGGQPGLAMRLLARGDGTGNVERFLFQGPGLAPLELPLSVGVVSMDKQAPGSLPVSGDVKMGGRESITVPLGTFAATRWIITEDKEITEIWTTDDPKVPFTGMLRMKNKDGAIEAVGAGADAQPKIKLF
jgi:hypothetical protein